MCTHSKVQEFLYSRVNTSYSVQALLIDAYRQKTERKQQLMLSSRAKI